MSAPNKYRADDMKHGDWPQFIDSDGYWYLCRPEGLSGLAGIRRRISLAWMVFTGRADALVWREP